jgi:predicted HTH domain antitoxin
VGCIHIGKKEREIYKNDIIHMFTKEKLNLSNIAKKLNINRLDVKKVLMSEGYYKETRKYIKNDPTTERLIIDLYTKEKLTIKEIVEIVNYAENTVKKVLREHNVPRRDAGFYNRKYTLNEKAFSEYSPESVYWAGFIAGDGCVFSHGISDKSINNCLNVTLANYDKEHLIKLKNFLGYNGKLYEGENKVALNINNREIVKDLEEKYNITNNKTETYIPPRNIPKELQKYFVLGLFDSDGCITRYKRPEAKNKHIKGDYAYTISFTGTKETCEYIKEFFSSKVKLVKRHQNKTNNYTVIFQGNLQVIKYLSMLYDETSKEFCLSRKYALFNELVEQYNISRL